MSRWDYDTVFYRVFCITLLAVAFTFTVILANVFVDIDGLLSKNDKGKMPKSEPVQNVVSGIVSVDMLPEGADKSEDVYDDKDYQDSNDLYRSKRSLESSDYLFHIKDAKIKKILTNRLVTLLDELDDEEPTSNNKNNHQVSANESKEDKNDISKQTPTENSMNCNKSDKDTKPQVTVDDDEKITKNEAGEIIEGLLRMKENKGRLKSSRDKTEKKDKDIKDDELLHLAMRNIILQEEFRNLVKDTIHLEKTNPKTDEEELFDVLLDFKDMQKQKDVERTKTSDSTNKKESRISENKDKQSASIINKPKGHSVMINATIDINSLANDKTNKESDLNSTDEINGVIKLIYNGKSVAFKRIDDDVNKNSQNVSNSSTVTTERATQTNVKPIGKSDSDTETDVLKQSYYKKLIHGYMKRIQRESNIGHEKVYSRKRLKRHIKIRFDSNKTTAKPIPKKDDDELFVEIETHFDSKGAKGEKKKKLIRDLIEKIQKAIHSDNSTVKKKHKRHWHVKKRTQNPLGKTAAAFINKLMLPLENLAHRHLDPISKAVPEHEKMPIVAHSSGYAHNLWQQKHSGPRFFGKNINSAEMGAIDTDYSKVMSHNGIPQRLQKPLNTDMSEEEIQENNSVVDLGNIKFLMKDIDGSGFSIGFNQYTDEAPDPETMKLFTGLEKIIETYHQKYDQESISDTQQQITNDNSQNNNEATVNENPEYQQPEKLNEHLIERRSIKSQEPDQHLNEYNIIYNHNYLPYDSYQEIYESDKSHTSKTKSFDKYKTKREDYTNNSPLIMDESLFEKDLKPAEILSIANLFDRRKRSLNVKKITNIKMKKKINRYLNTKSMATKSIFMNKKRNKRQIDKIRVVAREIPSLHKNSEEDIFVVSDEKVYADRALVRDVGMSELEPNDNVHLQDHFDIISPQRPEDSYDIINQPQPISDDHYDIVSPYTYESSPFEAQSDFSRRARHNSLMSKYPHIIMEEMTRSKEDIYQDETYRQSHNIEATTNAAVPTIAEIPDHIEDIAHLMTPPKDNSNYKLTVKIRPKNGTSMSGFKEIHTSINKSYNKNGLTYTSLVNVSQLSKVEKTHRNMSRRQLDQSEFANLKQQQDLIRSLVKQNKNRIDQQLKQLYIEKNKLETLNVDNPESIPENNCVNITFPAISRKLLHLTQHEIDKLLNADRTTTEASSPVIQTVVTEPTTVLTTTTEHVQQKTVENDKIKIINSIERSENITNELLKKIDQNTVVLKTFLGQLIAKLDTPSRKVDTEEGSKNEPNKSNNEIPQMNQPKTTNNNIPFNIDEYHQNIPNIYFRNVPRAPNNTVGIPFVYAYQQPYMVSNKEAPMASVVYHGHIHANPNDLYHQPDTKTNHYTDKNKEDIKTPANEKKEAEDKDFWKPKPGEKVLHDFVMKNNTKFFIDGSNSQYNDVIPLMKKTPPYSVLDLGVNSTKV